MTQSEPVLFLPDCPHTTGHRWACTWVIKLQGLLIASLSVGKLGRSSGSTHFSRQRGACWIYVNFPMLKTRCGSLSELGDPCPLSLEHLSLERMSWLKGAARWATIATSIQL